MQSKPAWLIYARDVAKAQVDAQIKKRLGHGYRVAVLMTYENAKKKGYEGDMNDWVYLLTKAKL